MTLYAWPSTFSHQQLVKSSRASTLSASLEVLWVDASRLPALMFFKSTVFRGTCGFRPSNHSTRCKPVLQNCQDDVIQHERRRSIRCKARSISVHCRCLPDLPVKLFHALLVWVVPSLSAWSLQHQVDFDALHHLDSPSYASTQYQTLSGALSRATVDSEH